MTTHMQAPVGNPLDLTLCGRLIFRGRYQYVKQDPTCSVCKRITARAAAAKWHRPGTLGPDKSHRYAGVPQRGVCRVSGCGCVEWKQ